ncbi:MAG: Gfo/Idh/MocA family oxidoreductase [Clostridium sp.]|nr:Gfo/Idh/MocA family oxidoreductase [Bacteroides sp.]MCM1198500.1 Gfo/Idh/MocA family oxidoreductase [Clostridium sp.]
MKIRICAIGFGNRTRKYLKYVQSHPDEAELCAVVDPDILRLADAVSHYGVSSGSCFSSVDEFLASGVKADAAIVATPDTSHYEIGMKVLKAGMHLLLEKPMAGTRSQCLDLVHEAEKAGVVAGLCYVMRYHPYYLRIKEIVDSGILGPMVSIRHKEIVGIERMTHTFVRGNWSREEDSSPIFISKCCHDVDFLLWLAGIRCCELRLPEDVRNIVQHSGELPVMFPDFPWSVVSSKGSLSRYCADSAPSGSAERCVTCPMEKKCRYSAVDLYLRRREWIGNFHVENTGDVEKSIVRELEYGRFGRCVYYCDNDVMDYQEARLVLPGGVTLDIVLDGITDGDGRETVIGFRDGLLTAKDGRIRICLADTATACAFPALLRSATLPCDGTSAASYGGCSQWQNEIVEDYSGLCTGPLHAGADLAIMEDFCHAIHTGAKMQCSLSDALPGSLACLDVERRRS